MTAGVVIGPVGAGERAAWEALWRAYLDFYDTSLAADIYEATWRRLQDPNEPMGVLGAYVDGRLCGIAHYVYHRSCWTIGDYCYLQDLFVASHARGRGLGRALIEAVCREARAAGASRVHWLTQEGNSPARALYDKVAERSGFIQYRKLF
jgi:GNAT superfamily N-acetyltransferase